MSILAKIPLDKERYSLYVNSKIINNVFFEGDGTILEFEKTAVLFYSYSNHRRAYVITELNNNYIPLLKGNLPLVKENVTIIYEARGRKVDILKFGIYNLEQMYGDKIYNFSISYWLLVTSLLDSYNKNSSTNKTKRNLKLLTEKYLRRKARENKQRHSKSIRN